MRRVVPFGVLKMKVLIIVSVAASLLMVGVGMIVAVLPARILSLSGSIQDVSYLASAFAVSYLLVQMPIGYFSDRFGAKLFLVCGYMLAAVSGLMLFFAESFNEIYLGRIIQGAAEAPIWALGPAFLSLAYPHAKGKVIGIYNAAIHAGLTLGPIVGLYLFANGSAGGPFLMFSALCLSGGLLMLFLLPKMSVIGDRMSVKVPGIVEFFDLLKNKTSVVTLSCILLYGAAYGICVSVLPAMLALEKDFDSLSNAVYFALFYISISIAQLIVGPLSDRHGRRIYMASGLVTAAIGFASFSFFTHPWIYVPLVIASIGLGIYCVTSIALLNESVPDELKSTISASYYLAWGSGYFIGPLVVGWFAYGYALLSFLMAAGSVAVMTILRT